MLRRSCGDRLYFKLRPDIYEHSLFSERRGSPSRHGQNVRVNIRGGTSLQHLPDRPGTARPVTSAAEMKGKTLRLYLLNEFL